LRPQPASASVTVIRTSPTHLEDAELAVRFTAISPNAAAPYKDWPLLARVSLIEFVAKFPAQPNFRSFSSRFSQALACARTFFGAVPP
jgi:hypothetical protein